MEHKNLKYFIKICEHGHVQLNIGHTTLHLELNQLATLVQTSLNALEKYQRVHPENLDNFNSLITH